MGSVGQAQLTLSIAAAQGVPLATAHQVQPGKTKKPRAAGVDKVVVAAEEPKADNAARQDQPLQSKGNDSRSSSPVPDSTRGRRAGFADDPNTGAAQGEMYEENPDSAAATIAGMNARAVSPSRRSPGPSTTTPTRRERRRVCRPCIPRPSCRLRISTSTPRVRSSSTRRRTCPTRESWRTRRTCTAWFATRCECKPS